MVGGCARLVTTLRHMQASSRAVPASLPVSSRLASAIWSLSQRHWRFVVIAMLALLHVAVLRGTADDWARALLLAHLGLLLLWQPFLRGEHQVSAMQGAVHRAWSRSR